MLAAEQSGAFQYKGLNSISEIEEKPTETMIDRLQDLNLSISGIKDSIFLSKATTSTVKPEVPEKASTTKPASSTRPLTVDDDDDLDIDLEIDDNIDTTVSMICYL